MHCQCSYLFFSLLFSGLFLIGSGCGKAPENYDSLRGDVLADLAEALDKRDTAAAEKSLDRLERLTEVHDFVTKLKEKEEVRELINELNKALAAGDIKRAKSTFSAHSTVFTSQAEMLGIPKKVEALEALDTYLAGKPYADAERMGRELQNVQQHARILATSQSFTQWLQNELNTLAGLRQKDQIKKIDILLQACDQAVVNDTVDSELTFARLLAFSPATDAARFYSQLRDGKTTLLEEGLKTGQTMPNQELKALEISLLACRQKIPQPTFNRILKNLPDTPPQSLAGHIIKIFSASQKNQPAEALLWIRRYLDAGGKIIPEHLEDISTAAILPAEQFNARIWRVPCPSIDDILGRFIQWQTLHMQPGDSK